MFLEPNSGFFRLEFQIQVFSGCRHPAVGTFGNLRFVYETRSACFSNYTWENYCYGYWQGRINTKGMTLLTKRCSMFVPKPSDTPPPHIWGGGIAKLHEGNVSAVQMSIVKVVLGPTLAGCSDVPK